RAPGAPHIWGRAVGRHGHQFCAANPGKRLDYDFFAVQAGIDLYYGEGPDSDSDRAGIYGAIGRGSGNSSLFDVPVGFNELDAYTVGGYWTHYGKEGWYLD